MLSIVDRNKKRFYSRIIGLLLLSENISEAKTLIEKMFVVLLNRYQYNENVTNAIQFLKKVTDTHHIPVDEIFNSEESKKDIMQKSTISETNVLKKKQKTKFSVWVENIVFEIRMNNVNDNLNNSSENAPTDMNENPFYADKLEMVLCTFLSKIHQWSNIMMNCFGSENKVPSSACSEAQFNVLKNVIFPNERKIRVDLFVRRYIDCLEGISIKRIVHKNTDNMVARQGSSSNAIDDCDSGKLFC